MSRDTTDRRRTPARQAQCGDEAELQRTADALRAQTEFLDTTIEQSPFAMWIADPKGLIWRTNKALRDTLNLTGEQIEGVYNVLEDRNLIDQGFIDQVRAVFTDAKETRFVLPWEAAKGGAVDFSGGRDLWIEVTMFPVVDSRGRLRSVVCQWVDITDLTNAKQALREHRDQLEELVAQRTAELQRSNEDLERFAYVASHDLSEPLRLISSFLTLLDHQYGEGLDEMARKYIAVAADGATRMQRLITDLLAYSRVDAYSGAVEAVDCGARVAEAIQNLSLSIEESGATVTVGDLPKVQGIPSLLTQAFQNLVANALKFRGEDPPRVEIHGLRRDEYWEIRVADNGIGIEPAHHQDVFSVFKRLHGSGEYAGSGIGLAVVQKVVERCGGTIHVESTLGAGATFVLRFPA